MHLGNGIVSPVCALAGFSVAALAIGAAGVAARRTRLTSPVKFALASAIVLGLQSINLPIGAGISGHLLGGALLAHWFGAAWAAIAMAVVLAMQTVLLGDGGASAYGLNVLSMSVVPCLLVWPCTRPLGSKPMFRLAVASFLSVVTAATLVAMALLSQYDARANAPSLVRSLMLVYAAAGLLEMLLSCGIASAVQASSRITALSAAGVLLACVVLGRTTSPDGLEFTLERFDLASTAGAVLDSIRPAGVAFFDSVEVWLGGVLVALILVSAVRRSPEEIHG